jgi:predicted ATPase
VTEGLPSGTVTFLFTDIEGSTRLLSELGDEYATALAEHRRVVREAVARHGGVEVDTQGDAFFVAFARASDAVAAAAEAQAALSLPVRMGLHTGEPQLTKSGYIGLDVHQAARICAVGHGGQVLVSQQTFDLVGADTRDLGPHRLKDLGEPVRLYQLGDGEFPPLRSLNASNLPTQQSPLVGRDEELAAAVAFLRDGARLLTLTGPGGTGKTRLALQVAAEVSGDFEDGVVWVPLASLRDPDLVVPAIEQAVESKRSLAEYLRGKSMLLVLDNFEQVIDAAAALVAPLSEAPDARLLVTSRSPLRLDSEQEFPVPPLADTHASELFVERARKIRPDFEPPKAVPEICARLDNLPLAIELAAARVRALEPEAILERLDRRLPLLTGGARDRPARQQTLRNAIEWSYELLNAAERQAFMRLAVFAGGFTLDAAERVCGVDLGLLESLVEKSLVRYEPDRFSMLETIREYAAETLEESRDADETRLRHAEYFVTLAERATEQLAGPAQEDSLALFDTERDNLSAACAWGLDGSAVLLGLRVCTARAGYFFQRDAPLEAGRWFELALERLAEAPSHLQAQLLRQAGSHAFFMGDTPKARQLLERSLALARELDDATGRARTLILLANVSDLETATGLREEAVGLLVEAGDSRRVANALHHLGETLRDRGAFERARQVLTDSETLSRELGDKRLAAATRHSLADLALDEGHFDHAREVYAAVLGEARRFESKLLGKACLGGLAATAAAEGEEERAARLWGAMERLESDLGMKMIDSERRRYEAFVVPACERFPELVAAGRAMDFQEVVEYGLTFDA